MEFQISKWSSSNAIQRTFCFDLVLHLGKWSNWQLFFWNRLCDRRDLQKAGLVLCVDGKLGDYQKNTIFSNKGLSRTDQFLCVSIWTKKPNHWVGRAGGISWPPSPPDLTPYDWFLSDYLGDIVYSEPPSTFYALITKRTEGAGSIDKDILRKFYKS